MLRSTPLNLLKVIQCHIGKDMMMMVMMMTLSVSERELLFPLDEIKISLDGFKCAGAVRYSTNGETHSGYFCADNLGKS